MQPCADACVGVRAPLGVYLCVRTSVFQHQRMPRCAPVRRVWRAGASKCLWALDVSCRPGTGRLSRAFGRFCRPGHRMAMQTVPQALRWTCALRLRCTGEGTLAAGAPIIQFSPIFCWLLEPSNRGRFVGWAIIQFSPIFCWLSEPSNWGHFVGWAIIQFPLLYGVHYNLRMGADGSSPCMCHVAEWWCASLLHFVLQAGGR